MRKTEVACYFSHQKLWLKIIEITSPQNLRQLFKFSYIANLKKPASFPGSILYFLDTHPLVFYTSMFHGIFDSYKT